MSNPAGMGAAESTPNGDAAGRPSGHSARPAKRVLLLGLGNDILTDDAIGLRVAAELRGRPEINQQITVRESSEMGLALLDLIVDFDTLVLVDAVQTGKAPVGFVHELQGDQLEALPTVSPHFLGIGEMLALGSQLGLQVPKRVTILGVEVQDPFTVSTEMSPELQTALPDIVNKVAAVLSKEMT